MGRTRSPSSIQAERFYRDGMKLVDIAVKMKVPESTVRRWKSTQHWDSSTPPNSKKKQSERSDNNKRAQNKIKERSEKKASGRKGGAPIGNTNAKGHKTPRGNTFALKHGGYSPVYWDALSDEEKKLIEDKYADPEVELIDQIKLYSVRELRLMRIINRYESATSPNGDETQCTTIQSTSKRENKRVFDGTLEEQAMQKEEYDELVRQQIKEGKRLPGRSVEEITQTENKHALIARLEDQLTRVSSAKNRAIAELASIQRENMKAEEAESNNAIIDDYLAVMLGGS